MSKGSIKRSKQGKRANARSPYNKYGKRPCAHCQALTVKHRRAAHGGSDAQAN